MEKKCRFMGEDGFSIGWRFLCGVIAVFALLFFVRTTEAKMLDLGGKPLIIGGYINQGVQYSIAGDQYDTKDDFQSAIFQVLLEAEYQPSSTVRLFVSGKFNADWAYPILDGSGEWEDKGFDEADDRLFILDDWDDFLGECHISWAPGNFFFRVGKQIVSWGETEGFRLMDQINPLDQRRGMTDVEFETTIIPVVLFRGEYRLPVRPTWLDDLGFQFIFNPNADFRGDKSVVLGNNVGGIWAVMSDVPLGGAFPNDFAHLGSFDANIKEPDNWDSDGFEYGVRINAVVLDSLITLNYFYGLDNLPVAKMTADPPRMEVSPYDGRMVMHLSQEGYYPRFRFLGGTFSTDIDTLQAEILGGVAPVIRLEAFYAFESTFGTTINTLEEFDEVRWALGVDWKVKIPLLNDKALFMISPQFYHRHIMDYPGTYGLAGLEDDNYQTTLTLSTTYFRARLRPIFFWQRDITNKSNGFKMQLSWEHSHEWNYTLGALVLDGDDAGLGFEPFDNKDHIYFTAAYRF